MVAFNKLLLVDEKEEDYWMIKNIIDGISNIQYSLDWASNFEDGLNQLKEHKHHFFIINPNIGNHNCLFLIRTINLYHQDTPSIILTGDNEIAIGHKALKLGAFDYVSPASLTVQYFEKLLLYRLGYSKIMERIEQEFQLRLQLQEDLCKEKHQNELKSKFISIAAHEFRTPLSAILSSTVLIEKYMQLQDYEKTMRHTKRIKSSIINLTGILEDFLSLTKLEEGEVHLRHEDFDLDDCLEEIIGEISTVKKEGQEIIYRNDFSNRFVNSDPHIIKNIVINLLSNAVKYSPEGKFIYLNVDSEDNILIFKVKDQGIGIPEIDQQYIFNRFFRAKNSSNAQGTGLGLNIVKKYVEILGGAIDFFSRLNEGTTFTVKIPLYQTPQQVPVLEESLKEN